MSNRWRYAVAVSVFLLGLGVLFYPYLVARLKPIKPLPEAVVDVTAAVEMGEPNRVIIAHLGIDAPLIYIDEHGEAAYQDALQHGVVHYPGTALPGQAGNVYIFAHSSDLAWAKGEYKTVFAKLPQMNNGDEIVLTGQDGVIYRYTVIERKVVGPKDLSVLDQGDGSRSLLSLQTSYPLGTALQRYIVIGELQQPQTHSQN